MGGSRKFATHPPEVVAMSHLLWYSGGRHSPEHQIDGDVAYHTQALLLPVERVHPGIVARIREADRARQRRYDRGHGCRRPIA